MNISSKKYSCATDMTKPLSRVAFVGIPCDERGEKAIIALRDNDVEIHVLTYDPETVALYIDDQRVECDDFADLLRTFGDTFIFEATTLGTTELVLATKGAVAKKAISVSFWYVEPKSYKRPRLDRVIHARDFELTREYIGFHAVPGFAYMLEHGVRQSVVFFLGFEGERLDQAFEQLPIHPRCASAVFGVPAFRPGWEVNSFANNARLLREKGIGSSIYYCGANDPATTLRLLKKIYQEKPTDYRLFLAPIGTKPQSIGLSLFLADHDQVGFIYDHPIRGAGRSSGFGVWHVFDVDFE